MIKSRFVLRGRLPLSRYELKIKAVQIICRLHKKVFALIKCG